MSKSNPQGGVTRPRSARRLVNSLDAPSHLVVLDQFPLANHRCPSPYGQTPVEPRDLETASRPQSDAIPGTETLSVRPGPPLWHARPFQPRNRSTGAGSLTRTQPTGTEESRDTPPRDMPARTWDEQSCMRSMLRSYRSRTPCPVGKLDIERRGAPVVCAGQAAVPSQRTAACPKVSALHRHFLGLPTLVLKRWPINAIPREVKVDASQPLRNAAAGDPNCARCCLACARKSNSR